MSTNFLENVNFSMSLARAPKVDFFGKGITLPSISIAPIMRQNQFATLKEQGDHMTFAPLDITFRIDEDMANYKEILNWMISIAKPESWAQYGRPIGTWHSANPLKSDFEIFLFSSKNNPIHSFTFKQAWPTDLSAIVIDIDQDQVTYPEVTVTFEYDTFEVSS